MTYTNPHRLLPMILAAAALAGFSSQAFADRGDLTASLKYGQAETSSYNTEQGERIEPDGDNALGISVGYEYDANWTAEFMYIKGEATDTRVNPGDPAISVDSTSIGVYGVYRSQIALSSPYFFGKIGFGKSDVEAKQGTVSRKNDDTGLSFGAGVGYQYSEQLAFEAEYFRDSDVFDYILISARFRIGQ